MPLIMVGIGETCTIQRIGGSEETRRFLANLGFVKFSKEEIEKDFDAFVKLFTWNQAAEQAGTPELKKRRNRKYLIAGSGVFSCCFSFIFLQTLLSAHIPLKNQWVPPAASF